MNSSLGNPTIELRQLLFHGHEYVPRAQEVADDVDQLKRLLLESTSSQDKFTIWKRLRALQVEPDAAEAREVYGVIGEVGTKSGSALVFGMEDGSASMYTSTGGALIGGGAHETVRRACEHLIAQARPFVDVLSVVDEFPQPAPGRLRFSLLTPRGVLAGWGSDRAISSGQHELSPLFTAWDGLVKQLRLLDPDERSAASRIRAPAYANCLLTLMVDRSISSLTINYEQPPPDLCPLATSLEDQRFLDEIGLPCDEIDTHTVVSILLHLAGFRWYHLFKTASVLKAKLARPGGHVLDVAFDVKKATDKENRKCLVIERR